jgi:hypothetical protein
MKLMVAFRNFVNKPKNGKVKIYKTLILPFLYGCKTYMNRKHSLRVFDNWVLRRSLQLHIRG